MPVQKDLAIWKGNTFKLPLRFAQRDGQNLAPLPLTGSTLVFRASWAGGALRRDTDDASFEITNAAQGEAKLSLTAAETRLLPQGKARYEIERHIGDEQVTWLYGTITCSEWANDD